MSLPLFSGRFATSIAACTFAPELIPGEDAFFLGQTAGHNECVLVRNGDDFIDDLQMEIVRNKTRPSSLYLVRTRLQRLAFQGLRYHR